MAAGRAVPPAGGLAPMLATTASAPPSGSGWLCEPKLDGYRLLAHARAEGARLFTRSGRDVTAEFAPIAREVERLAQAVAAASDAREASLPLVFDGELVVQEGSEAPAFQRMQRYRDYGTGRLRYYVFDLLRQGADDVTALPLRARRGRLAALLRGRTRARGAIRLLPRLRGMPATAFRTATAAGHEGVVCKRADSTYHAGRRSEEWLKVKRVQSEDLVVGGYTRGTGRRARTLGALLVGNLTPRGLVYAGHVGTGFDERTLGQLLKLLAPLRVTTCPFVERPPVNEPATWVRPTIVVEVRYAERTEDGILRAPVFVRVRDDKRPADTAPAVTVGETSAAHPAPLVPRDVRSVLDQLDQLDREGTLEIGRVRLRVTNLDKPLWPLPPSKRVRHRGANALTKRDLLRYLARTSPFLLAHLRHRPVTLARYPDGAGRPGFYQRHWDGAVPAHLKSVTLSVADELPERDFILIDSLPALLHAGQLGAIEFHPWYTRIDSDNPDFVVFDLDSYLYAGHERPGDEPAPHAAGFDAARRAARLVKEQLDALGLTSFIKTSGKTGLHVFVPIRRRMSYEATHTMARTLAEHLERRHPTLLTTSWAVPARRGKVFLDYNQNARGKTLAAAYSPRAAPGAPVSTPLEWDELDAISPFALTVESVPKRLAERGDPWARILDAPVNLASRLNAA